jgi:translation elongation factor EF-G
MSVEDPLILIAVQPSTGPHDERLRLGLATLTGEDPRLHVKRDAITGEVVIGAMNERHLEIAIDRLAREFGVEAAVGRPQIVYKETRSQATEGGKLGSVRLEPVMYVVVLAPQECAIRIVESLSRRRGRIESKESRDGTVKVRASVPLAEMWGYDHDLRSRTYGRGTYSMVLYEYRPVPEPPLLDPETGVREPRPRAPTGRRGAASIAEPEPEPDEGL